MSLEVKNPIGSVGADLHKSSAFGVSGANLFPLERHEHQEWFVAIVPHQKYMLRCREFLEKTKRREAYIASRKELHVYPNRTKREVEKIIISRMVFVRLASRDEAFRLVGECPYIDYFLPDRAKERERLGRIALATVPQQAMDDLRLAIANTNPAEAIEFSDEELKCIGSIEVVRGGLKGIEGGYIHQGRKDYIVISLGIAGNIKVQVPIEDCVVRKKE